MPFENRRHAGRELAAALLARRDKWNLHSANAVVIGLPRGGLPVAEEIARVLEAPLDVCVVRKVGVPAQPELALAAVAEGEEIFVNEGIRRTLGLSRETVEALAEPRRREVLDRVARFREGRPAAGLRGKTAVLVDDGAATGATALVAVRHLRAMGAAKVVLALPVCPDDAIAELATRVDELLVLSHPRDFGSVGQWYVDFTQVEDEEVQDCLRRAWHDFHKV